MLFAIHANQFARATFLALADMVSVHLDTQAPPPAYAILAGGAMVANTDPMAARTLVRRVVADGIVTIPLDAELPGATSDQMATLAGWALRANPGAAWLAVRSGRPLFLATTYWDGTRLVVEYSGPLSAQAGMSKPEQVQALTERLYERANRWIQAHPGQWLGWTQIESFTARPSAARPEAAHATR
jgi:lauroyl/myristoyl acyltransferase